MKKLWLGLAAAVVLVPLAEAHFRLLEPKSWVVENDVGNPQKPGPCGGTEGDASITTTGAVTPVQGGHKLHIKVQETVYHPGHYRIALAVTRNELPEDPIVTTRDTDKGPRSVSAKIDNPVKIPILADGLFQHTARATAPFETDVMLPNINCAACILQIVEFMAEHAYNNPGGYSYHHCAVLNITADPSKPVDHGWPAAH